jgi:hypothetical protein
MMLAERPSLAEHACHASGVHRFGAVIVGTTLPHLLEHLTIDLLVEAHPGIQFAGTTSWLDDEAGTMLVRVSAIAGSAFEGSLPKQQPEWNRFLSPTALAEALQTAVVLINTAVGES